MMVERRSFPFGMVYFQGQTVKLPGGRCDDFSFEIRFVFLEPFETQRFSQLRQGAKGGVGMRFPQDKN